MTISSVKLAKLLVKQGIIGTTDEAHNYVKRYISQIPAKVLGEVYRGSLSEHRQVQGYILTDAQADLVRAYIKIHHVAYNRRLPKVSHNMDIIVLAEELSNRIIREGY